MILQQYIITFVDGNRRRREVTATGNTLKAAVSVAHLHAMQTFATPVQMVDLRPVQETI